MTTGLDHWTDKQETKTAVDNLIRDTLWEGLPECYDETSISTCRTRVYEYVYMRYGNAAGWSRKKEAKDRFHGVLGDRAKPD